MYLVWRKTVKNQSDLFQLIPRHQSEWIRNQVFNSDQSEWIRARIYLNRILIENLVWINRSSNWFGLISIKKLVSDWVGFIRINVSELIGLSRIDFWLFSIKRDTKRFSDWFGMICIGSDTDIGMNRNSSDWLVMNFNPILLPRFLFLCKRHGLDSEFGSRLNGSYWERIRCWC